ncbi:MAG TPA: AarF/UbiB family protein [Candidatus Limnocylindrales bacterium]|nr:AarF/UbiB family protein [Candidatus Limnocylindrales bacterium]
MRRFIVQAVIDALTAFAVVFVLSRIEINQPFPFGADSAPIMQPAGNGILAYLVWGAIFVIVNRVVRPILVALFGRLLFATLGLFVVVLTALAIGIASWLAPGDVGNLADPQPLWLLLTAALFTLAELVLDVVLGLSRPHVGAPAGGAIWTALESLPTPRRNALIENLRLQQVYEALYQTSIDIAFEDTPIGASRRWFERVVLGEKRLVEDENAPQRVAALLQQLGPTYVKIGQMMAARTDILPPEWTDEFVRLQADAAPFPWEDAREVIIAELKGPPEELFGSFEQEPFAAASTAQVHRATLLDGTPVAVKVQRPKIVAKTKADLGVMQELAKTAEKRFSLARRIAIRGMVGEFAKGVLEELDYRNEAYHARRLTDSMSRFERVHIPIVYSDLSSSRILTMEFVRGIKITDTERLREAGIDESELGATFMRAIIKQVLIDGFFHGDPHPGNILVDPENGQIIFLDLGLVGQLSAEQRIDLLGLVYALKEVDLSGIADSLIALGKPTPAYDEAALRSAVDRLGRQYLVYGEADSIGGALSGFLGAVFEHGLQLDSQLTLAVKAIVQAEDTATRLAYDLDMGQAAVEEAQAALLASLEPDVVMKQVQGHAIKIGKELARRAPSLEDSVLRWLDLLNRGKIVVEVDTSELNRSVGKVGDVGRQATVGLIVVGQLIGTAIVMAIMLQPSLVEYQGVAYAAMIAFGVTLVVSFIVLFRMFLNRGGDD